MRSIAKILIKILSMYFFINFLTSGIYQIAFMIGTDERRGIIFIGYLLKELINFFIVVYLWLSAEKISKFIIFPLPFLKVCQFSL